MLDAKYKLVLATDETQTAVTLLDKDVNEFGGPWGSVDMEGKPLYIIVENVPALADVQAQQITVINDACATELLAGFNSSALGTPHKYDSAIVDQLNFMQAYAIAQVTNAPVEYRVWNEDGTKSFYPHTAAQFETVYQDGATVKAAALTKCATLKISITAATTNDAVTAIVW